MRSGKSGDFGVFKDQQPCPSGLLCGALMMATVVSALLLAPRLASADIEPEPMDAGAAGQFAQAWDSYWSNRFTQCTQQVAGQAKSKATVVRWHAQHLKARALWTTEDPQSRRAAKIIWSQMAKNARVDQFTTARGHVAQAMMVADSGKQTQAIKLLERVIELELASIITAEARIDLALLLADEGKKEEALKQLDQAAWFLDNAQSLSIDERLQKVFFKAVERARELVESPGKRAFDKATGLMGERQYAPARAIFNRLIEQHPTSIWAVRSDLAIGHCWIGLRRIDRAIEHWRSFIGKQPAGPWRGQAFVALIDLYLEQQLSLADAAEYVTMSMSSLPAALKDDKAAESWGLVQYDLQLRSGLVHLLQKQSAKAAEAFKQTKTLTDKRILAENIDRLIEVAEKDQPLIPSDAAEGKEEATLALSMGMIYALTGDRDKAHELFERVAGTALVTVESDPPGKSAKPTSPPVPPLRAANRTQTAFAVFGVGMIAQDQEQTDSVKELFLRSMKIAPDGTWHDETVYRIATGIERVASDMRRKMETAAEAAAAKSCKPRPAVDDKAGLEHLKMLASALPYWSIIIDRCENSPRYAQALFRMAMISSELADAGLSEQGQPAELPQREQLYEAAVATLSTLGEHAPLGVFTGDAHAWLIQDALERVADAKAARERASKAVDWAKAILGGKELTVEKSPVWGKDIGIPDDSDLWYAARECILRSAITAYLTDERDVAHKWVALAGVKEINGSFVSNRDMQEVALYFIRKTIASTKPMTDARVLAAIQDDRHATLVRLADVYLDIVRPDRAEVVCRRLSSNDNGLGRVPVEAQAYAMLNLATALDRQIDRRPEALVVLQELVDRRELQGSYWGGIASFRLALFTFNQTQDPDQAIPLYRSMLRQYPDHDRAERAMFYLFFAALHMKDKSVAIETGKSFLAKHPKGRYAETVKRILDKHGSRN